MRRHEWVFIAAVMWIVSGVGLGTARADDVQVNTYTTDDQLRASVALETDGDFVVVWESHGSGGTDSSLESIQGQRYASDGSTVGGEFQINTYTTSSQRNPSLALDADGDFVVVWSSVGSAGTDSSYHSIQGQRYASDGSTAGGEFQVNTNTTGWQRLAGVAMDAGGDFVVVWQSFDGTSPSFYSVQARRYASNGVPVGDEFRVNTYTTIYQAKASVAMDADGDFVVVWNSPGSSGTDTSSSSVQGRRYASDGSTAGGEFQVNTYTTSFQTDASVAMDADGDFVVTWISNGSSGTDSWYASIQGQRFASDGSAAGGQFQVNSYTPLNQVQSSVGMAAAGDFVVAWVREGYILPPETPGDSVHAQRYASDGSAVGGEVQVSCNPADYIWTVGFPSVGVAGDGDFVVAWESHFFTWPPSGEGNPGGTDTVGFSIRKTRGPLIFADGFESGDTSAWN